MAESICEIKHNDINKRLDQHDQHFSKLDSDVEDLKGAKTRTEVVVEQLCKKIDLLLTVFVGIFLAMFGFIIWYIQAPK
jgi:nitrate reductase NapE component